MYPLPVRTGDLFPLMQPNKDKENPLGKIMSNQSVESTYI